MSAKRARGSAKAQLSKIGTFVENEAAEATPAKLKIKLEMLEKHYAKFHAAQDEIEEKATDEELPAEQIVSDSFDDLYCDIKAQILELLDSVSAASSNSNTTEPRVCNSHSNDNFFKPPTVHIKPFTGDYLEWTPFKDMFKSMINAYPRMPEINKFHLLKSSLDGEPLNLIKSISLTAQNYREAWMMLEERYSNKTLIIKVHLSQIFSMEKSNGTVSSLKAVLDTISSNVRALENLQLEPSSLSDAILFHIVMSKLDQRSKDLFNEERNPDPNESNYRRVLKFLSMQVNTLADLPSGKDLQPAQQSKSTKRTPEVKAHQLTTPTASIKMKGCIYCGNDHPLYRCPQFTGKTIAQRYETVKNSKEPICFNCFRTNHQATKCFDKNTCKECGQKHHTLLHFTKSTSQPKPADVSKPAEVPVPANVKVDVCTITKLSTNQVLLATVLLYVKDAHGQYQQVRAFLDPGAQANLITKSAVDKLQLPSNPFSLTLTGVTNLKRQSNKIVECEIASRVSEFKSSIHAVVVSQICSKLPSQCVATGKLPLHDKMLADPEFHKPSDIDLLLCGEHYLDLFVEGHILGTDITPSMQNTVFGWIVAGKSVIAKSKHDTHEVLANFCSISTEPEALVNHCAVSAALEKFWSTEDINSAETHLTMEEQACETHFVENVTRLVNGRFEVAIPLKANPTMLGNSRDIALKVLQYTQRRLDSAQKSEYKAFMDEYVRLGHMVKICNPDLSIPHAYLPHHPVIKTTSKTTELRVVFNGAKPTSTGVSVNDIHMKGPIIQNDLFSILI